MSGLLFDEQDMNKRLYHGVMANLLYVVMNYVSNQDFAGAKRMAVHAYILAWRLQNKKGNPDIVKLKTMNTEEIVSELGLLYHEGGFTPNESEGGMLMPTLRRK